MELPAPALLAGVFLAGILVGYAIRAFISARRRARARRYSDAMISNDLNERPSQRLFSCARRQVAKASAAWSRSGFKQRAAGRDDGDANA
jgi:xanthosine utilization system XapX-like protein